MFETGVECQVRGQNRDIISIFFDMKVYRVFLLESPRGDSNKYTQYTIFNIKRKLSKTAAMGYFLGTQERVRNSHGKRTISVRATEVLL